MHDLYRTGVGTSYEVVAGCIYGVGEHEIEIWSREWASLKCEKDGRVPVETSAAAVLCTGRSAVAVFDKWQHRNYIQSGTWARFSNSVENGGR